MIKPILIFGALLLALVVLLLLGKIKRSVFLSLAGLVVVVGALVVIKLSQFVTMASMPWVQPPDSVTTATATQTVWQPQLSSVGTLSAIEGVTVSAELDGNVARILFQAGAKVKAGDLLVQQDIGAEEAQLQSAEAAVELARVNLERSRQLLADQTIAQSQFDTDDATYKQAVAQVENIRAVIAKKTIRAPFSGRLGIRLADLGQTLKAGDPIVSLQALDPIYADFYLPQQDLGSIHTGMNVQVTCDALPGRVISGPVTAINPDVDSDTRNVRIEATLQNPDEALRPGMFVNANVQLAQGNPVLVIPSTAVLYAPYGNSVFVLEQGKDASGAPTLVVRQQFVRIGEARGDFVTVTDGLKAGDQVVSAGVFKLRNGESVTVNNALALPAQLAPKPSNS